VSVNKIIIRSLNTDCLLLLFGEKKGTTVKKIKQRKVTEAKHYSAGIKE
jgi:hypothetical protein